MSSENLQKLYEDIYSTPTKESKENKEVEESVSQQIPINTTEQKKKTYPKRPSSDHNPLSYFQCLSNFF